MSRRHLYRSWLRMSSHEVELCAPLVFEQDQLPRGVGPRDVRDLQGPLGELLQAGHHRVTEEQHPVVRKEYQLP